MPCGVPRTRHLQCRSTPANDACRSARAAHRSPSTRGAFPRHETTADKVTRARYPADHDQPNGLATARRSSPRCRTWAKGKSPHTNRRNLPRSGNVHLHQERCVLYRAGEIPDQGEVAPARFRRTPFRWKISAVTGAMPEKMRSRVRCRATDRLQQALTPDLRWPCQGLVIDDVKKRKGSEGIDRRTA